MPANKGPQRLTERHRNAAYLAALGKKPSEIAQELGFSPQRVSVLMASPLFQALVEQYRAELVSEEEIAKKLRRNVHKATDVVYDLMDDDDPRVKLGAARTSLEFGRPRQVEERSERIIRLEFDASILRQIQQAYEGFEPIEVTAQPATALPAKTVDELVAELQATEEEASETL